MFTNQHPTFGSFQKQFLKIFLLLPYLVVQTQQAFAQFSDDFSDGDFTSGTIWSGDTPKFSITSEKLKLSAPAVNGTAYLSTPSRAINSATWEFEVQLDFNPSSSNYARVYLVSDRPDLSGHVNGYFVSIGSASDEISLYRQSESAVSEIIDGSDNRINFSTVTTRVKVTRDDGGTWELFTDVGMSGSYVLEGNATDATYAASSYVGLKAVYTSTRSDKFHFDNFSVSGNPFVDNVAPTWNSITVKSEYSLELLFTEPLDETSATTPENFLLNTGLRPSEIILSESRLRIELTFQESFPNGVESQLTVSGLSDTVMNVMSDETKTFLYFNPAPTHKKDVIITEIFADVSPVIGLPNNQFIEIFNRSENPVQLDGWTLSDPFTDGVLPSKILLPNELVILTNSSGAAALSSFGEVLTVSNFPTLNVASDMLIVKDASGNTIDSIAYSKDWYRDEDKQQGGWTLEIIDPDNFCKGEENWTASVDSVGGTPGSINSVDQDIIDSTGPKVMSAEQTSDSTIMLLFDENLQVATPQITSFTIQPELEIDSVVMSSLRTVSLIFATPLQSGKTYKIMCEEIFDCSGNEIGSSDHYAFINLDTIAPVISKITVQSSTTLKVNFSERLDTVTAIELQNFSVANVQPVKVVLEQSDSSIVIEFEQEFPNGVVQELFVSGVEDINGNVVETFSAFRYFQPSPVAAKDVIIIEIFADPTPVVGMPEAEFVEIYNRSENPISLEGWTINDLTGSANLQDLILLPQDYLILTGTSSSSYHLDTLGRCMHINGYRTLTNSGEPIVLKSDTGITIDSVYFKTSWFRDNDKKDGGYSLELIDPSNFCKQHLNWMATRSENGGTPGFVNSVDSTIIDDAGPRVLNASLTDSTSLEITFDDFLNTDLSSPTFFFNGLDLVDSIGFISGDYTKLGLRLSEPIISERMYEVTMAGLSDCGGNVIQQDDAKFFLNYDDVPPHLDSLILLDSVSVRCYFNDALVNADVRSNYHILSSGLNPDSVWISEDEKVVTLHFSQTFRNGFPDLLVFEVEDFNQNISKDTISFLYFKSQPVQPRDIVISEIFADPTPPASLPEYEFVELYNRSENVVQLKNWYFQDGASTARLTEYILQPKSYVVLTSSAGYVSYTASGSQVLSVSSFPSLSNFGEPIVIREPDSTLIDSVRYSNAWYRNDEKSDGGYSLELIDPENICKQHLNWIASRSMEGGTPGSVNSVDSTIVDDEGPRVASIVVDSIELRLTFDDFLNDDLSTVKMFFNGINLVDSLFFTSPSCTEIGVRLRSALLLEKMYEVEIDSVFDCFGNKIETEDATFYLNVDSLAPKLDSIVVRDANKLICYFNESISQDSDANVEFEIGEASPTTISFFPGGKSIELFFADSFSNGVTEHLRYTLEDINGNIASDSVAFLFFKEGKTSLHDVIISEIFADPTPVVALPEYEFIELYNRSQNPIQLDGWYLTDDNTTVNFPAYILQPDSYLLITGASGYNAYNDKTKVLKVSGFPSLTNTGEHLTLYNSDSTIIDDVKYSGLWYKDAEKRDGGWSLERIDRNNFCKDDVNWMASRSEAGGTPGSQNSVDSVIVDVQGPKVTSVDILTPTTIALTFDEAVAPEPNPDSITVVPSNTLIDASYYEGNHSVLVLTLTDSIENEMEYAVTISRIADCEGNVSPSVTVVLQEDSIPPSIGSVAVLSAHSLKMMFSEKILDSVIEDHKRFEIVGGPVANSAMPGVDNRSVVLTFAENFENGVQRDLKVFGLTDINNNSQDVITTFTYFNESSINKYDLIVTEIFSDPSPTYGLPEAEFIEILNRSRNPIELSSLLITDGTRNGQLHDGILLPGQYAILCDKSNAPKFSSFGQVCSVTDFPSLNNSEDVIILKSRLDKTIDSVAYNLSWIASGEDADGGVSLEKIDPENTCEEETNWTSSEDESGGTPGRRNSVYANKPDITPPVIISVVAMVDDTISVSFNEKLNDFAPGISSFNITNNISVEQVLLAEDLRTIKLIVSEPLQQSISYTIFFSEIFDCAGNELEPVSFEILLPEQPLLQDVVINEVLFNPRAGGVDFIEIYNRSDKYIDLKDLYVTNVSGDSVANQQRISTVISILKPDQYAVVTTDAEILGNEYPVSKKENFVIAKSLPSMPDSEGNVAIVANGNDLIDSFYYSDEMHSPFLKDVSGVSLERVSIEKATNDISNWKSASKSSGYATPGYANSNTLNHHQFSDDIIKIEPEIFEPIFGQPDFAAVNYKFDRGGFIANVRIFDVHGREIKTIAENEILGTEGFFRWDGDRNDGAKAAIGNYMVLIEVFDETGELQRFKKRVAVAAKF